ncbi:MAG: hypothetical protein J3R72DRAFT_31445 [Linnemannia gamsii]|nr:MAG: hypothetical protein J3R72DRAFT_31445 [Linnemannia gamsii]
MSQTFDEPFYSDMDACIKRPHNDRVLQDMVQFVLDHLRIFKGQLKSIRCFDNGVWDWMDWKSIDRMELDFFRHLPPMEKPTHIGKDNWRRFSAHPQSTIVTHVQGFSSKAIQASWQDIISNNQSILQRFRSLKSLDLSDFRAGTFNWAVQEKRELERAGGITASDITHAGRGSLASEEALTPTHWTHGLVPLERVYIKRQTVTCADDIDDLAFAFSETLKRIRVSAESPLLKYRPKSISIGKGWVNLPALTLLTLQVDSDRLVLDPRLLTHCPNLAFLRLNDMSRDYQCRDIVPCLPTHLKRLGCLQLGGWSALTFDPVTLSSTRSLKTMKIRVQPWCGENRDVIGYIPAVEELNQSYGIQYGPATTASDSAPAMIRSRWTWDWELPLLTRLYLSSEFAYLFEFKVLHGCPALEHLHLDISSATPGEHRRVVSEADFLAPTNNSWSTLLPTSQQPSSKCLCLPSLTYLILGGEWVIDNTVMHRLLTKVFPGVKELTLKWWNTITTLESLLKVLRAEPQKFDSSVYVNISLPPPEDMARLGIITYHPPDENNRKVLDVNVESYFGVDRYYLLHGFE